MVGCINETGGKFYAYRMSKVSINMAFRSFAAEVKEKDVKVAIIHPGMV